MIPERFTAAKLEDGQTCPCCQQTIRAGQSVIRCPDCQHLQHETCWTSTGRCHSYDCLPQNAASSDGRSAIVVTPADMAKVVPPTPRPVGLGWAPPMPVVRRRLSKLALTSFVCAVAGGVAGLAISLTGMVGGLDSPILRGSVFAGVIAGAIAGLVAILFGAIAVGFINTRRDRSGSVFAAAGIIIGTLGIVGWTAGGCLFLMQHPHGSDELSPPEVSGSANAIQLDENTPPIIRRAIRANVMIEVSSVASTVMGSGIILANNHGELLILTNRHVVGTAENGSLTVSFADGSRSHGKVKWRANDDLDVALVTCAPTGSFEVAALPSQVHLETGSEVFAVGNPLGLGWSYVKGVISAVRRTPSAGLQVRILQLQVPLNPGNSGGGLYDGSGGLIGINTFIASHTMSEGISFSLAVADLVPLIEEHGGIRLQTIDAQPKPAGSDR